jgi:hypothetical protein
MLFICRVFYTKQTRLLNEIGSGSQLVWSRRKMNKHERSMSRCKAKLIYVFTKRNDCICNDNCIVRKRITRRTRVRCNRRSIDVTDRRTFVNRKIYSRAQTSFSRESYGPSEPANCYPNFCGIQFGLSMQEPMLSYP